MKVSYLFSFLVLGALVSSRLSYGEVFENLSLEQQKSVLIGEQILDFEPVEDELWPKAMAWQKTDATPLEAIAIFTDYASQHEYVYRMLESTPYEVSMGSIKVHYKIDLEKIRYVPESILKWFTDSEYNLEQMPPENHNNFYRCSWRLVEETKTLAQTEGYAVFEPLPNSQGTLIYYENFVSPNVSGRFGWAKTLAMSSESTIAAVKRGGSEALQSIVDHINSIIKTDRDYVSTRVADFQKLVKGNQ